jgi:hypothetical protein
MAKLGEKYTVSSLAVTKTERQPNGELGGNLPKKVIRFCAECKAVLGIPFVPTLAA